jgi:p-cumate 2,3-dioxygenase alpha subunit
MEEQTYIIDDRQMPRFRVHRSTMTDPVILASERQKIFDQCWLYVGHESELPNPHDFRTRKVGGRPIIFNRSTDGTIQVMINACSHRGMQIETRADGNGRFLKCFYHGWSYKSSGELVAMPDEKSYGPNFDKEKLCLARPAKVQSYRGFVFLSWTDDIVDLSDYLAGARDYLDLIADQSEVGMQIVEGTHLYSMQANWKLLVENSIDGYHAMTTHHRYLEMLADSGVDLKTAFDSGGAPPRGFDLGNGHTVIAAVDGSAGTKLGLGRGFPDDSTRDKHLVRRARAVELYGEDWANRMFASRNLLIFPNLIIVDLVMGCTVRTFYPDEPGFMDVTGWQILPEDEERELRDMRMTNFLTFWGPAGLATPDDIEALERCQKGFAATGAASWNDISRGMSSEAPGFTEELQMRVFWRRWNELITGQPSMPEGPVFTANGRGPIAQLNPVGL